MTLNLSGKHLIAGHWLSGEGVFLSSPAEGPTREFAIGNVDLVARACVAAEAAFASFSSSSRAVRAAFLRSIGDEIEKRADAITQIGTEETGLPNARIQGERGRTVSQLRLFADYIDKGEYLDRRIDKALPGRQPPRPEIRLIQRPVGPVAVFGASNFPLAFSTAGGDTAAALAAGCPVIVKGHSAHPGTGEIVAQAIEAAIRKHALHPGVFSLIQGGNRQVGEALVQNRLIKAVGFTGSIAGGRALFNLCAARSEPIPFFGELGSVNPMFVMPNALEENAEAIGQGWAGSLTMGAGQFCTNPGITVVVDGDAANRFLASTANALQQTGPQTMLTDGIASAYRDGQARFDAHEHVRATLRTESRGRTASPNLYDVDTSEFLADHTLSEEVFGPLGVIVRVKSVEEMRRVAEAFVGQLTATIHMTDADIEDARSLLAIVERKSGRILVNGFPTGVEVVDSMVHGGPYPASTNFGATSVGTMSIRRFIRPVSYQNLPLGLLPEDLREI